MDKEKLENACANGQVEIVTSLIDAGVSAHSRMCYIYKYAVQYLSDRNLKDGLLAACSNGHVKIAKLIINAGTDVSVGYFCRHVVLHLIANLA